MAEAEAEAEEEEGDEFSRRELIIESTKFAEFVSTLRILWNKDPRLLVIHESPAKECLLHPPFRRKYRSGNDLFVSHER